MFKKQKSLLQIREEGFVYSSGKEEFWNRYPRVFDRGAKIIPPARRVE